MMKEDGAAKAGPGRTGGQLGTFSGVFTPSILTILGIILFLRLGYVTGAVGILGTLAIILMANAISVLTSISLSAIATNLRVKGGGDYYLISRTLGVEYGGALGLVLFLAQSVSIGFYCIGFGEVTASMFGPHAEWLPQLIAAVAVAGLFVLAWLGSDWATRFQYIVMAILFMAIVGFFAGGLPDWSALRFQENLDPAILPGAAEGGGLTLPFWTAFAIFFPAVTGFTQGVSMSGDLKNPGRSLPTGTFLAVGLSLVVYIGVAVVFAGTLEGADLVADYGAMRRVALMPALIDAGVIAATLSSALASFLGAPRILQSLASDRVFPVFNLFATVHGPTGNPRRGVLLSAGIAFATIVLGDLNAIAPVVSMFFLISYGLLNYATYIEARASSPSFRPRFRFFNEKLSLAGALGCALVMLAIHPTAALVAILMLFGLYHYVSSTVSVDRWADSGRSQRFQRMREDLLTISKEPEHPRYWRPVLLAFSRDADRRARILRFASWLEGHSGLTTAVHIVQGEGPPARRVRKDAEDGLRAEIEKQGLAAFSRAIVAPSVEHVLPVLLQAYGLGPVRANTVLLNWFDRAGEERGLRDYGRYLRMALRFGCNLVMLGADDQDFVALEEIRPADRRIDVWHRDNATGRLMLLLAYLMTRTGPWEDAKIRLLATAAKDESPEQALGRLGQMLEEVRIVAKVEIVDSADAETVIRGSTDSAVVFLPFGLGDKGPNCIYGSLPELVAELGIVTLVLAAEDIVLDTDPEGGEYAEISQVLDAADKAQKTARKAEKEAVKAADEAEDREERLVQAQAEGAEVDELAEMEGKHREAAEEARRSKRKAAKARAKADSLAGEAEAVTGRPGGTETGEGEEP